MFNKFIVATLAAALVTSPVAASAAPERVAAPTVGEEEQLLGTFVLPFLVAIAVAIGIWLAVDGDDAPVSP